MRCSEQARNFPVRHRRQLVIERRLLLFLKRRDAQLAAALGYGGSPAPSKLGDFAVRSAAQKLLVDRTPFPADRNAFRVTPASNRLDRAAQLPGQLHIGHGAEQRILLLRPESLGPIALFRRIRRSPRRAPIRDAEPAAPAFHRRHRAAGLPGNLLVRELRQQRILFPRPENQFGVHLGPLQCDTPRSHRAYAAAQKSRHAPIGPLAQQPFFARRPVWRARATPRRPAAREPVRCSEQARNFPVRMAANLSARGLGCRTLRALPQRGSARLCPAIFMNRLLAIVHWSSAAGRLSGECFPDGPRSGDSVGTRPAETHLAAWRHANSSRSNRQWYHGQPP